MSRRWAKLVALVVCAASGACAGPRRFTLKHPMWLDQDKRAFAAKPAEYHSSFLWDGADQMAFRPFAEAWWLELAHEAVNVNALDEVPDSAWFTGRIGRHPMSPARAARGPCERPLLDTAGPWTVMGAKPNGLNPGFPIEAADGRRYMIKFDGTVQGPRATAADVIVSKIYWAAGYATPCNQVVFFDRNILKIAAGAKSESADGDEVAMTEADLDLVFSKAVRLPDGRYRASASLYVEGEPIGPFRYEGTRGDDPNDVVPHEDRRELRASYVLGAWTNHTDAREQNTLDTWVRARGGGYVQHYIIDFGDCLGSIWEPPMLGRRIGYSSYLAADHVLGDWLSLGLVDRPWDHARFGPSGPVFAYYRVAGFVPDAWRPGYPNPAMQRMTERDAAWMARIIARMSPAHLRAMIGAGHLDDPALEAELTRIMLGRRRLLLARWLSRLSPLSHPWVQSRAGHAELCSSDLGVESGIFAAGLRRYAARAWLGERLVPMSLAPRAVGAELCVSLPPLSSASPAHPGYLIVDLYAQSGSQARAPARVHLYHLGGASYRVVGLERPSDDAPPR